MFSPKLWVVLCSDTEDNQPNYVPGWSKRGSNYDRSPPTIRWDWARYWRSLSQYFQSLRIPLTWLIRVDDGPIYDMMLTKFKSRIFELLSDGDEVGIHIHTFSWMSRSSKWKQTKNPQRQSEIVHRSIAYFRKVLGFSPLSVRMGWNTMSGEIMQALEEEGILVDASGIPGSYSTGKFGGRDNFWDWRGVVDYPYHPSRKNYRLLGGRRILEMPLSTYSANAGSRVFGFMVNRVLNSKIGRLLCPLPTFTSKLGLNPNPFFYISPHWSEANLRLILAKAVQRAKEKDEFLVGFFHASDILNPRSGGENRFFLRKIGRVVKSIQTLQGIETRFLTLSKAAVMADRMRAHRKDGRCIS